MKKPAPRNLSSSATELRRLATPPLLLEKPALASPPPARPQPPIPSIALLALADALPSDYYLG
jgi:hypothetical protein